MNRTSHTDEPYGGEGLNQSPRVFSNDLTVNEDFNGRINQRRRRSSQDSHHPVDDALSIPARNTTLEDDIPEKEESQCRAEPMASNHESQGAVEKTSGQPVIVPGPEGTEPVPGGDGSSPGRKTVMHKTKHALVTFAKFIGPGFMIAVAYIDPGNYATDIAAGASYRFKLLFMVFLSNLIAILLQSLAIKLGTVTGMDLSTMCRCFLPKWLNYALYVLAEIAIIATDIAEVIGTAIALNLLFPSLPLVAGCALSILDVMVILIFYRPSGTMTGLRSFEVFVCCLVIGVVICFCIQLSLIQQTPVGDVFKGYLPSGALVKSEGLYQACGILGATVMPHSLFLGSGIVQPRLKEYDIKKGMLPAEALTPERTGEDASEKVTYIPSQSAIKHCLKYSITELALSLFTFALFVNSAILIVAGASLYGNPKALTADIFGIHDLLSQSIAPVAGTIFALALLLSGISAGVICTIAGQMISEGALNWKMSPWLRRLVTRSISITPSIIIAGAVGRSGLDAALTGSQVALSTVLPFVTLPLIYFTCRKRYMTVRPGMARLQLQNDEEGHPTPADGGISMANSWLLSIVSVLVWLIITVMNVANLVLLGLGRSS